MKYSIPLIIPAYEPDYRMIELLKTLEGSNRTIIIVDDGSGDEYKKIFDEARNAIGENGIVITHEVNKGKGRALKTAFSYVLEHFPEAIGVVTADSDGQHTREAINSVTNKLMEYPNSLVLGARNFNENGIPWKCAFGNKLTVKVLSYVSGIIITDTQTGLRGISRNFLQELLEVRGERFEFEIEMLVASTGSYPIIEVPIATIYDSKDNHQTHFNPVSDSIKIYKVLGRRFLKYILSSISSSIIDLLLFSFFCFWFRNEQSVWYVVMSTILARVISATYNYIINYKVVFESKKNIGKAATKYVCLAAVQMALSALFVTLGVRMIFFAPEVVIKVIVDTILFFVSYKVQQKLVF